MTDPFAWWRAALAGKPVTIHEGEPQSGYYRVRKRGGPWEPVAIWSDGTRMISLRGEREIDPVEIWTYAAKHPVSYEAYEQAAAGRGWPEDIDKEVDAAKAATPASGLAEAGMGHNSGEPHEIVLDEIDAMDRAFSAWLESIGGKIADPTHDEKAETFRTRFRDLKKKADDTRDELVRPHLEAQRTINATWKPVVGKAEAGQKRVGDAVVAYRVEQDRIRREEAAKAAEAARLAEEARRAEEAAGGVVAAMLAAPPPPAAPVGRAAKKGFRTVKVLTLTDPIAAVTHILTVAPDQPDILDAVRVVARRMIEAGVAVPGATITEEQRA